MSQASAPDALKLLVTDEEDLKVASCCLQDALVPVFDICFQRAEKRFVMVVNRFKWEHEADLDPAHEAPPDEPPGPVFQRTHCGVVFEGVRSVKCRGVDPLQRGRILELLAMEHADGGILLHFAGGGCLRLETDAVQGRLEDIGECWPTTTRPRHVVEGEMAAENS